jgi:hypothetical protein
VGVTRIGVAQQDVEQAETMDVLLDAAYAAFEEIISALREHQDASGDAFAAFGFAAAAAADGRDALADSPSLPPSRRLHSKPGGFPGGMDDPAGNLPAAVVCLADLMAARLSAAPGLATLPRDRSACLLAARLAAQVSDLLTGHGP